MLNEVNHPKDYPSKEYAGADRRHDDGGERHASPMSVVITGNKLPLLVLLSLVTSLVVSVIYGTVWLIKIDDRSVDNTKTAQANSRLIAEQGRLLGEIQQSAAVTANILDNLSDKVAYISVVQSDHLKEAEMWKQKVIRNEEQDRAHHSDHMQHRNEITNRYAQPPKD